MNGLLLLWVLSGLAFLLFVAARKGSTRRHPLANWGGALACMLAVGLASLPLQQSLSRTLNASLSEKALKFVGKPASELEHALGNLSRRASTSPDGSLIATLDATPWYAPLGDARVIVAVNKEQRVFHVSFDD